MDFDRSTSRLQVFRVDLQNFYDALQERAAYLHQRLKPGVPVFQRDCVWLITQQVGSTCLSCAYRIIKETASIDDRL